MKRVVIIGLDGVPYSLLKDLSGRGIMPHTQSILEGGLFRKMESSLPEVSSVAWSSLITGKNPGEHGIFGFTDLTQGTYQIYFPNFTHLKAPPFWKRDNTKSAIINVPSTFPAAELNGVHISGFVALSLEESTYPPSLVPKLKELDYRIDVDSSLAHKSLDLFVEDLDKTLKARKELFRYLWKKEDWQAFMLVFTDTDRLMHFLWSAYEDEHSKYHEFFLDHFRQIDAIIGEILRSIDDATALCMLSDHGFERLEKEVNINFILRREGFLRAADRQTITWADIDFSATTAFALDPARIYLNLEGRYPKGRITQANKGKVLGQIESLFNALEVDGKKVIKSLHRKEDSYHGPYTQAAPDLVLVANQGFDLKASIKAQKIADTNIFTGKHSKDEAFLLLHKKYEKLNMPQRLVISDVVGILDTVRIF